VEIMDTKSSRTIQFPGNQEKVSTKASRQIQNVDGIKYYTDQQIKLFRRTVVTGPPLTSNVVKSLP